MSATDFGFDEDTRALEAARELDKQKAAEKALGGDKPPAPEAEGGFTRWMKNLPRNVGVGLIDAALNTLDAVQPEKPDAAKEGAPQGTFTAGMYTPPMTPAQKRMGLMDDEHGQAMSAVRGFRNELARGSRTSDSITQGIAQFLVPFTGYMKAFNGARAAATSSKLAQVAGKVGQAAAAESATVATAFDPHADRLADLVEFGKHTEGKLADALNAMSPDGSAINAYFDYMTSRDDESDAEGRFKNVVDSLAGSAVVAGVFTAGAKSLRSARAFANSPIKLPEIGAPKQLPEVSMNAADEAEAMRLQGQNFDSALRNYERQQEELMAQRTGMRIQTAEIIDKLAADSVSPREVAKQFWDVTYDTIRPDLQERFQQYAGGLGYGVDSDEGITAFFSKKLPVDAAKLEGNSRGIIAQMHWANEHLSGAPEHLTGADMLLPDLVNAATPAAGTKARSAFEDMLEKALKREAMEAQGRNILEDMVEAGESPRSAGEKFWRDTYYKLNAQTQQRFQRYAKNLGFEPGQTLAVNADGSTVVAKDWQEVGEFLLGDMPKSADQLEGIERGFVSLMKWANTQADEISKKQHISTALTQADGNPHAAMVHLTEQADNVLDDAERATILAARNKVAQGLPEQGYTVVPSPEGHTVVAGKQPVLTFTSEEDAVAAVTDAQRLFGTNFQQRAAQEQAKASDASFATLHSFSRVLAANKDRPVSTHSLLSSLERNLKGDTETGAFYKELLGRLVRKKLGGTTTVVSKSARKESTVGHYATAMNAIELYEGAFKDPKRLIHTFAHEAVHAATMHEMNASAAVMRKMETLRKQAIETLAPAEQPSGSKEFDEAAAAQDKTRTEKSQYGFTNAYEFVAEIESNPEFRKLMQKTKLEDGATAWDKYIETIAGILGVGSLVATPTGLKEFSKLMMGPKQEEKPVG